MKIFKTSSVLAAVLVGGFAGSARASGVVDVKVPFSFVIKGEEFPAGHYQLRDEDSNGLVSVRGTDSKDRREFIFAFSIPANGHDPLGSTPSVVFTKYENQYRLSQIWESDIDGRALMGAEPIRKMARGEPPVALDGSLTYVLAATQQ